MGHEWKLGTLSQTTIVRRRNKTGAADRVVPRTWLRLMLELPGENLGKVTTAQSWRGWSLATAASSSFYPQTNVAGGGFCYFTEAQRG